VFFGSAVFLFCFLPIALLIFWLAPRRWRMPVLFILSLTFYAWGDPLFLPLLACSAVGNYYLGKLVVKGSRPALVIGIVANFIPLAIFKYLHFALAQFGAESLLGSWHVRLPVGISFYTFMAVSYLIDLHRGRVAPATKLTDFGAYLTMFPHLVAGPIVRWATVRTQILSHKFDPVLAAEGGRRFIIGLAKKSVLSDSISTMVDQTFAQGAGTQSLATSWIVMIAYSLQIYLDFSGYSDMAIGLAGMLGIRFEENFAYPYVARTVAEFWRRWHISLGSWFRDYVYIPLGGSRVSQLMLWRNLFIVWFLTGLWHGANWTFITWGLWFGLLLGLEKTLWGRYIARAPKIVQHAYVLLAVVISWVFFRSPNMTYAMTWLKGMFWPTHGWWGDAGWWLREDAVLLVIAVFAAFAIVPRLIARFVPQLPTLWAAEETMPRAKADAKDVGGLDLGAAGAVDYGPEAPVAYPEAPQSPTGGVFDPVGSSAVVETRLRNWGTWRTRVTIGVEAVWLLGILVVAIAFVIAATYHPFIYFRF
jgi:alginate O-acetyltransferase complex protein AlgI